MGVKDEKAESKMYRSKWWGFKSSYLTSFHFLPFLENKLKNT